MRPTSTVLRELGEGNLPWLLDRRHGVGGLSRGVQGDRLRGGGAVRRGETAGSPAE